MKYQDNDLLDKSFIEDGKHSRWCDGNFLLAETEVAITPWYLHGWKIKCAPSVC